MNSGGYLRPYELQEIEVRSAPQVIRGDVWNDPAVLAAANGADARVYCVAYVTQACDEMLKPDDVLVCDASRKAVSCGETDPRFLLRLLKRLKWLTRLRLLLLSNHLLNNQRIEEPLARCGQLKSLLTEMIHAVWQLRFFNSSTLKF